MKRLILLTLSVLIPIATTPAQKKPGSPTDVVVSFYRELREKHYVEGFRHSVYRGAVEGLTVVELQDLEPDFARTFSAIPDKIEPGNQEVSGETATVSLKFEGVEEVQKVSLVRVGNEWLVGDKETLGLVNSQGRSFFFNARMLVNEGEAYEMLQRIIGAEVIYSRKFEGRNASLQELIRLGGIPKDIEDGEASGYRFSLVLSADEKSFFATAVPTSYGKTGKISFYGDLSGVRGEDLRGQQATVKSKVYLPK